MMLRNSTDSSALYGNGNSKHFYVARKMANVHDTPRSLLRRFHCVRLAGPSAQYLRVARNCGWVEVDEFVIGGEKSGKCGRGAEAKTIVTDAGPSYPPILKDQSHDPVNQSQSNNNHDGL